MRWCPIAVRADLNQPSAVSGIYLIDDNTHSEFVIALSTELSKQVQANGNRAICALEVSLKRVVWETVELGHTVSLTDLNEDLAKYAREFTIVPSKEVKLLVFKFLDDDKFGDRAKCATKPFNVFAPQAPMQVSLTSSPFAASHVSLFHEYVTTGTLNLVNRNFFCVDARYLDGMEGGNINADASSSVGLIVGSLIKSNGEGRLLIAVPWSLLAKYLGTIIKLPAVVRQATAQQAKDLGVVAVRIKVKPNIISWGSGVLVEPDLVVTNKHVVGDYPHDKIDALIGDSTSPVMAVTYPLKSADLAVLKLRQRFPSACRPVNLAANDPANSDFIRSIGYGLFAPHRYSSVLEPLQSDGIVSKAVPGMLITTAGCWNGSSGGGIFNADNELVGLMASNVRDNGAGEIMPDVAMSIPISVIRRALGEAVNTSNQKLANENDDDFQRLWKLNRMHQDVRRPLLAKL